MKKWYGYSNDYHSTKILSNGDVIDARTGEVIDNLRAFAP
jgi:hypothetical protein